MQPAPDAARMATDELESTRRDRIEQLCTSGLQPRSDEQDTDRSGLDATALPGGATRHPLRVYGMTASRTARVPASTTFVARPGRSAPTAARSTTSPEEAHDNPSRRSFVRSHQCCCARQSDREAWHHAQSSPGDALGCPEGTRQKREPASVLPARHDRGQEGAPVVCGPFTARRTGARQLPSVSIVFGSRSTDSIAQLEGIPSGCARNPAELRNSGVLSVHEQGRPRIHATRVTDKTPELPLLERLGSSVPNVASRRLINRLTGSRAASCTRRGRDARSQGLSAVNGSGFLMDGRRRIADQLR